MKKILQLFLVGIIIITGSCAPFVFEIDPENTPEENFESLWKTVDEKYSFFEFKNIDWDEVYNRYRPLIYEDMDDEELFYVLFDMLSELRDAHVNLWAPFDVSRYEKIFLNSPQNFNRDILYRNYMKEDYRITGSLTNHIIDGIGYIRYSSFMNDVTDKDLNIVLERFAHLPGIVIDVRDNGGGALSYAFSIASRFTGEKIHAFDSYLKNGPGHADFAQKNEVFLEPSDETKYLKPVIVLTNRSSYSATNDFAALMKAIPQVTLMGDTTGGGGGIPTGGELPNGWGYRFSASQTILPDGFNIEDGIPPDIVIWNKPEDEINGIDTILEEAIKQLKNN